jgi:redox-sensing transcriptional repressor
MLGELQVEPASSISDRCRELGVVLGVVAVPPESAQRAADALVAGGVDIIFNYTEALVGVPDTVTVHTINPAEEMLYALYFYLT